MFWDMLLLSAALSVDVFVAALALGAGGVRIPARSSLAVVVIHTASLCLALLIGGAAGAVMPVGAVQTAGGVVLLAIGLYKVAEGAAKAFDPVKADADGSKTLSVQESAALAVPLALDGVAAGLGVGVGGVGAWGLSAACLCMFTLGWAAMLGGGALARRADGKLPFNASVSGGLALIGVAITRFI